MIEDYREMRVNYGRLTHPELFKYCSNFLRVRNLSRRTALVYCMLFLSALELRRDDDGGIRQGPNA